MMFLIQYGENCRGRSTFLLRRWLMEGFTHHFAIGIGHRAAELKKLGRAIDIETVVVTEEKR